MYGLAFRRQLVLAVVAIGAVVVENALAGSLDGEVTGASAGLGLVCLAPVVFAWSPTAYRVAAGLLAFVLTVAAIRTALIGDASFAPVAIVACLTLLPVRWMLSGTKTDLWSCAIWQAKRTA